MFTLVDWSLLQLHTTTCSWWNISHTPKKKTIHLSTCHGQVTIVILSFPSIFTREPPTFFSSAPCPSAPGSAPGSSHAKHRAGRLGAVLKPWSLAYKNLRKNRLFNVFPLSFENFMCNYTLCDVTLIHYLVWPSHCVLYIYSIVGAPYSFNKMLINSGNKFMPIIVPGLRYKIELVTSIHGVIYQQTYHVWGAPPC